MINLSVYTNIKDKCCLAYFGDCDDYLLQLAFFRERIEAQLNGLTFYIAAKDCSLGLLADYGNILPLSNIKNRKHEFGYFREILCNVENHPIEQLLLESNITWLSKSCDQEPINDRCLIVHKGGYPTRALDEDQIQRLMAEASCRGLRPEFGSDPTNVGHVWGVESWQLWKHASTVSQAGSLLVPTGIGTRFYMSTFSHIKVLEL